MRLVVGTGQCTAAERTTEQCDDEQYSWALFFPQHRSIVDS